VLYESFYYNINAKADKNNWYGNMFISLYSVSNFGETGNLFTKKTPQCHHDSKYGDSQQKLSA